MKKNYLIYPCKTLRITQSYIGMTSHYPHTVGQPKDFPIDEGGKDSGRDYFFSPCDEIKVVKIYGVGNGGTNTIWLQSTGKVFFADGGDDYVTIQVTHPNDDDLKKLSVGQIFKRGQSIFREGTDGATGNHFHISAGKGKMKGNGWTKSTTGKWILTVSNETSRPEQLFFVDPSFTKVIDSKDIKFKNLPVNDNSNPIDESVYRPGNYKVTKADVLNVRKGAGTKYKSLTFYELSKSAQKKILTITKEKMFNGYVKGVTFTVSKVEDNWGKTPSGWVCLDFCEAI